MTNLIEQEGDVATPPDYLEDAQGYLIHRFSKIPKPQEPLVLEFTTDKALLHQYYLLRNQMIGRYINAPIVTDDVYDKISEILVARRGNAVIGGCRLTIREGDESFLLPMEHENFQLRDKFSDLPLNKERHGIISKFVILEEHRGDETLYGLSKIMFDKVVSLDTRYIFSCTSYVLARNWRKIANILGAKTTRICEDVEVPENPNFPAQKPYFIFSDMTELCQKRFPRITIPTARRLELVNS
jgi:hypothetical protein